MAFQDPVIDKRFCKPHTLHMGQIGGILHGGRIGNIMRDGFLLLKLTKSDGLHFISDSANKTVATLCEKPTSRRLNGWTLYRGRSTKEHDTICKSESRPENLSTYIYLGSVYKGKHQSKNQKPDYIIESSPATVYKCDPLHLLAHQVHNVCVRSTNSGPKIRVYPGADYVFVYALIVIHKCWGYPSWSSVYGKPPPLAHTLCSCRRCAGASLHLHTSSHRAPAPLVAVSNIATVDHNSGKVYSHNNLDDGDVFDGDLVMMAMAYCEKAASSISFSSIVKLRPMLILIVLEAVLFFGFGTKLITPN